MMLSALRLFVARLRAFVRPGALDRDFEQELDAHLDMLTADYVARGMTADDARRQARLRLGQPSSLRVRHRDVRGFGAVDDLLQDLRFAVRLTVKERWFSAAAVAAIALGIGANTVGFTIVNAAFFRGFGFAEEERLLAVSWRPDSGRRAPLSVADLEDLRRQSRAFSALAGYTFGALNISDEHAPPEQTQGAWATANLFDVLRQPPILGRTFVAGEDHRGAGPAVIIGYDLWKHRYGSDANVIGRTLRINGRAATIVGVMPERMKFPDNSEVWVPLVPTDPQLAREQRMLDVIGRLAPGTAPSQAAAEIASIAGGIMAAHPNETKRLAGGQVETLGERYLASVARAMFITVMGAVVFVLLIACANVANLLLSRAVHRGREVAVRYSLGATRWRIVRQLLIESLILAGLGGVLGLMLATYSVSAFDAAVQTSQPPYWLFFTIDYRVLIYVAGICVATGTLFGLTPALHVSRDNQHVMLKEGARGTAGTVRAARLGNGLVVAELALTVVLLCGAGLMLRSFLALYAVDPGFDMNGLTRMRMQLPPAKYPTTDARRQFFEQLQPQLAAIPGMQRAAIGTSVPPLDDAEWRFEIEGQQAGPGDPRPWVSTVTITPEYFDVLGVRMNRGRALNASDGAPGAENVVISDVMAQRFFAGTDPIGRRIRFLPPSTEPGQHQPWRTIVGVSAPFLQGASDDAFRSSVVYLPLRQSAPRTVSLLMRSSLPPASVMQAVQSAVRGVDRDQPVLAIETVAEVMAGERLIYRIFATLFILLAAIGVLLSAVGVYGVMAYAVTQRTQEIGVRIAVGARRRDVSWLFLKRGMSQLALGLMIGVPAALALAVVAQFRLVEIEPTDSVTMVAVTLVVTAVVVVSCLVPVRNATRVNPVVALRAD
jgi:predicted permease